MDIPIDRLILPGHKGSSKVKESISIDRAGTEQVFNRTRKFNGEAS